ncbi:MAG: sulfatase-like hydrolase/transferase [Verrucomicrobiota bacterium]
MKQNIPNILILMTDQQRFDTIAAAGYDHMHTPNLDRLVNEGCLFSNAYTPNPVCVAARHSMLTGTSSADHGFEFNLGATDDRMANDGLPTYARLLSENGYFTALAGKAHYKPVREHHGFDHLRLMEEIPGHLFDDAYMQHLHNEGLGEIKSPHGVRPLIYHIPQDPLMPDENHGTYWLADQAIDLITKNHDRPWAITVSWIHPHPPLHVPRKWRDLYKNKELPTPVPPCRHHPYPEGDNEWMGDHLPENQLREFREAYYGSISMIDDAIGSILDHLERQKTLDNTCILFLSDHGEMLGDKGMFQKTSPYEPSCRIPFIIRYPKRITPGTVDRRFVDLTDVLPTLLDAVNISFPYKKSHENCRIKGSSLLSRKDDRDRTYQFTENHFGSNRWVAARDPRYKYVFFFNGGVEQFFDLEADPQECTNLIGSNAMPVAEYQRLKKACMAHESQWGPDGYVTRWGFDGRASTKTDPRGCAYFTHFPNSQFPSIGNEAPMTKAKRHIQELEQALKSQNGQLPWEPSSVVKTYLEEWKNKFVLAYGNDETTEELNDLAEAFIERATRQTMQSSASGD